MAGCHAECPWARRGSAGGSQQRRVSPTWRSGADAAISSVGMYVIAALK